MSMIDDTEYAGHNRSRFFLVLIFFCGCRKVYEVHTITLRKSFISFLGRVITR